MARRKSPAALMAGAQAQPLAIRDRLLELAGCDIVEQAALTRRVIDKNCQLMSAKRVTRLVVNAGLHQSEVREFIDEDGALQARASETIIDLLGLKPSKTTAASGVGTALQVNVTLLQPPGEAKPQRVKAQVVDITDTTHNTGLRLST